MIELLSNEKQINAQTPPGFLVHGINDTTVKVCNSDNYVAALKAANVPSEYMRLDDFPHSGLAEDDWDAQVRAKRRIQIVV